MPPLYFGLGMAKIVNPDGSIKYTTGHLARTSREPKSYPICSAPNRNGGTCGRPAGTGTPHKGIGHCYFHGGLQQIPGTGTLKNALTRSITYPGIQEEVERLRQDRDVFDLREHIFLMEAISTTILNKAKTMEDLGQVMKYVEMCAKVIQKLDEIEHGRRLVIELPEVKLILDQVKEVIFRHISDSHTRNLVSQDLRQVPIGRASFTDIPSNLLPAPQSGVAMESGTGRRDED